MLRDDSPLKLMPSNMDRKQMLYLDGVRQCAETCDLAYQRLAHQLTMIARTEGRIDSKLVTSVFMHAWAVADSMYRLHRLLRVMPGFKYFPEPNKLSFDESIEQVIKLRNVNDHVADAIDQVLSSGAPTLGYLKWVTVSENNDSLGISCTLIPGTVAAGLKATWDSIAPRPEVGPTDHITLKAGNYIASLTDAMGALYKTIKMIETAVDQGLEKSSATYSWGENIIMRAHMNKEGTAANATIQGLTNAALKFIPKTNNTKQSD